MCKQYWDGKSALKRGDLLQVEAMDEDYKGLHWFDAVYLCEDFDGWLVMSVIETDGVAPDTIYDGWKMNPHSLRPVEEKYRV